MGNGAQTGCDGKEEGNGREGRDEKGAMADTPSN